MSHQTFGAPATQPSWTGKGIDIAASNADNYGLLRGPNRSDAVSATHRVGGNLDADSNYLILTLNGDRFPGIEGNAFSVTITDGANRVRYRPGSNLIEIRHAANSLAGVKAAVDADGGRFVTASAVTGQDAQQPAAYTENGVFSGGVDEVFAKHRKLLIMSKAGNADIGLIKSTGASAPAQAVNPDFIASRGSWPILFDLPGDMYLYAIALGSGSVVNTISDGFSIREYTDLIGLQPEMVSHSV